MMKEIFGELNFWLHKWHSNVEVLEDSDPADAQTYAKTQLGVKPNETKTLGVLWNKRTDEIVVVFPEIPVEPTRQRVIRKLPSCYDPIGLVGPILLIRKLTSRDRCELGIPWDESLPDIYRKKWEKWKSELPRTISVPRAFHLKQETNQLHRNLCIWRCKQNWNNLHLSPNCWSQQNRDYPRKISLYHDGNLLQCTWSQISARTLNQLWRTNQ